MTMTRRSFVGAGLATALAPRLARAQSDNTIRIGVITDMSGIYRDVSGPTTVACAQQAAAEFMAANPSIKVEILVADHQNKADVGLAIIRKWFDQDGVDVIENVGNSSIALGAKYLIEDKNKVALITTAGSSDLTGKSCSANLVHWSWDSWCLAHSTATSLVRTGGSKWFFLTADYAFGHAAEADAAKFVKAAGGTVLGSVRYPFGSTSDFSSFLLQAQSSGANVIAFANSGNELINCLKQAQEFGLDQGGARMAALVGYVTDVIGMGLSTAKGLSLTETFYWDLNERTRAFMNRVKPRLAANVYPNMSQAGDYACVLHYLKAVKELGAEQAKRNGREVVELMKKMPTDDDCFGQGMIRADGRKIHPAYLFEVKKPAESTSTGDVYKLVSTLSATEAFRPLDEGSCALARS
ncbi:ABC transporter substrate-binding protein [Bradyrhizobium diazoefficiens]|uniref:Putative substrate-binding protein n=1 Tax=Bradyrhizobium diazoefficiens SEMIA 5080 TaxID=754504 RepID=A0A837CJY1_9BRAD|nr:ABC transporter substrate-binding protein [Bradyrhizobium diazoefficiens]APO54290.1 ABC transporter permease [Bradyrhizobium diazoefficiens]KGJ69201.1 putative substrate-binding protein [Bradyrhizobium diazoefficiens SEMIA 5080]KOY11232.1 ABC transporter permease [Bradyrhizobium diazoefficiens]MCD9292891.1 ABC transporter substrate-binding protein [Bradyrhizobium diazoefficiens]MCD9808149.1 ABC transporter substrate-binding protein [Bradyrhizobium diazoefficiens]